MRGAPPPPTVTTLIEYVRAGRRTTPRSIQTPADHHSCVDLSICTLHTLSCCRSLTESHTRPTKGWMKSSGLWVVV